MMRFLCGFLLLLCVPAYCDDQPKARGLLDKVTAMATDPAGKRAVSLATSEILVVPRTELVQRRKSMNMSYGELFVACQLTKSGARIEEITAKVKNGETIWQIANEMHADWKAITAEARKLNSRVDSNLLKHFAERKARDGKEQSEAGYDPYADTVKADANVTQKQIEEAQERYLFLRDHSEGNSGSTLDTSTEQSARMVRTDPVRTGGPSNPDVITHPGPK